MKMKSAHSKQAGAALIVALVALLMLTLLGVSTMSDVINQSSVLRNEQFRQKVFYAASSELNVQIDSVNDNEQYQDDPIIDSMLNTGTDGKNMYLEITEAADPKILTDPDEVNLTNASINGNRSEFGLVCSGESIGLNAITGYIETTAELDDGRGSIKSSQRQRYEYCWP